MAAKQESHYSIKPVDIVKRRRVFPQNCPAKRNFRVKNCHPAQGFRRFPRRGGCRGSAGRGAAPPLPRSPARPSARRLDGEKAVDELVYLYAAEVWRMIGERDRAVRRQRDGQVAGGIFGGVAQDVVKHAPQRARELPA